MKYCNRCECKLGGKLLKELTPDYLIKMVCDSLSIPVGRLIGNRRDRNYCEARHMICDMLYNDLKLTKERIGRLIGGRHHSTVINSIRTCENWCLTDYEFKKKYLRVHLLVYGHVNYFRYTDEYFDENFPDLKRKIYIESN